MTKEAQELLARIDRSGGPDACHLWTGPVNRDGYGTSRGYLVSRVVLELHLGRPLLPGMCALHTCDNEPCCNVRHLYEGTHQQNMADARARRRFRTKVTPELEQQILALREMTKAEIARRVGLTRFTVARVLASHAAPR